MHHHLSKMLPFPLHHSLPSLQFMFTSGLVERPREEPINSITYIARQILVGVVLGKEIMCVLFNKMYCADATDTH